MRMTTLAMALGSVLLTGCSSMMQKNDFDSFNSKVEAGDYKSASAVALDNADYDAETGKTDDLLWTIQAGATLSYAGDTALSTKMLDQSESMMKSEDKESTVEKSAETVGSIVGNDAMLDYEQTQYDGVMANTIKAWNFIGENDFQNARVELNRAEERQRRAAEFFASQIKDQKEELKEKGGDSAELVKSSLESDATKKALKSAGFEQEKWQPYKGYVNPFTTYTYGLNLVINGKTKSDYQKAVDSFKRVYGLTKSKAVKKDLQLARALAKGKSHSKKNKVWVVFENGKSAIKEEVRLDLPLFLLSDNVAYTGIALPKLKTRGVTYPYVSVNGQKTETIADMDKIIGAEFDKEFPYILAREVTRATVKTIAQKQAGDKNELLGQGLAVLQAITTGADIRSFSALPNQYQVTQLDKKGETMEIKAGNFTIPVKLDKTASNHIIYVKAVSPSIEPTVKVTNI